ncbi:MAG: amidase [Balneolaceae bacterium]|nr:MAG: amidase [Balneolaceae bacterium]
MKLQFLTAISLIIFLNSCQSEITVTEFDRLGLSEITIEELHAGYENGAFTIREVTAAYLERIENIDRKGVQLNSVLSVHPGALERAAELDAILQSDGITTPLFGIPVLLKDNIDTFDLPTTAGSRFMEHSIPAKDAFIVNQLREQGAVILGKTNLSEWANFHSSFSSSGWSGLGGQVKNPYELSRNPCGSSSGSGAATSANLAAVTIGTETNGSIVCPSNANGIVGMKPTVGLWSRSGIIPISHTTDSAGPMTRTVRDAAVLLGALAGVDEADDMTRYSDGRAYPDYTQFLNPDGISGKRIGFYTAPVGNHFRVDSLMNETIRFFEEMGAEIIELSQISETNVGGAAFNVLLYEFKDGLNHYFSSLGEDAPLKSIEHLAELTKASADERERFDRNLIFLAAEKEGLDSEEYRESLERMLLHSREQGIDRVMELHNLDAIISPTGSPAWKTDLTLGDNFKLSSSSPSARAGYPIITVPMGDLDGLPFGLSIFGTAWSEPVLLEIAYSFEQNRPRRIVPQFLP